MPRLPRPPRLSLPPRLSEAGLGSALRQAGTPRGQLLGLALIVVPAVTNALPLTGAPHTLLQLLAVMIGTFGMVVVFGGMVQRAVLAQPNLTADIDTDTANTPGSRFEAALLAVPHARAAWRAMALLCAVLVAGALWCLVLVFGQDAGTHLSDALMLALPGLVLSWAAWRARVMRIVPSRSESAQR